MSECSDVSTSSDIQPSDKPTLERQMSVGQAEGIAQTTAAGATGGRSATPDVMLYDKYLSKWVFLDLILRGVENLWIIMSP
jgi:hypothetical protein